MKLAGASILVVEDETDLREMIVDQFTYIGAKVQSVSNGKLAWELIQKHPFQIVFSDIRMPGGDGVQLIKNIHQMTQPKPHIFLCTGFSELSLEEARSYGVLEVFTKPFDMNAVVTSMLTAIKGAGSTKAR